jgi:arginyl-tRNA--protein-N-Asp/Glu arginylyltransferase
VYLGYRVAGCPSLQYKGTFRPHEVLGDEGWTVPEAANRGDSQECR